MNGMSALKEDTPEEWSLSCHVSTECKGSQEEGFHQEPNWTAPWPWTSPPSKWWDINVSYLSHPVYGIFVVAARAEWDRFLRAYHQRSLRRGARDCSVPGCPTLRKCHWSCHSSEPKSLQLLQRSCVIWHATLCGIVKARKTLVKTLFISKPHAGVECSIYS